MRNFRGIEQGPDFNRARQLIATPFQYKDIRLDAPGVNEMLLVSGDFLYVDASSTGVVTIELNNQYSDASAPFQAGAGFGLNAVFYQLKLNWQAQAGKFVRLMYSTGDRVVPTNSTSISGTVSVQNTGEEYQTSFKSKAALAALTAQTVFTPAQNTNGAIIWNAAAVSCHGSALLVAMIAKNGAPADIDDGDVIAVSSLAYYSSMVAANLQFEGNTKIQAGKGLYFIASAAMTGGQQLRNVNYTLL